VERHFWADVLYVIGTLSIVFVVVRTYYRLSKLKKGTGFARKKAEPDDREQGKS
jgi:hypothetical protein